MPRFNLTYLKNIDSHTISIESTDGTSIKNPEPLFEDPPGQYLRKVIFEIIQPNGTKNSVHFDSPTVNGYDPSVRDLIEIYTRENGTDTLRDRKRHSQMPGQGGGDD